MRLSEKLLQSSPFRVYKESYVSGRSCVKSRNADSVVFGRLPGASVKLYSACQSKCKLLLQSMRHPVGTLTLQLPSSFSGNVSAPTARAFSSHSTVCDFHCGDFPAHKAIEAGDLLELKTPLEGGYSVETRNQQGETLLHVAAKEDNVVALTMLLQAGARLFARCDADAVASDKAPILSESGRFLHALHMLFQVNDIRSGGFPLRLVPCFKEAVVGSILEQMSDGGATRYLDNMEDCFVESLRLEKYLWDPQTTPELGAAAIQYYFSKMPDDGFLWLTSGFDGHATNLVVDRSLERGWTYQISNLGVGAREHHEKDSYGRVYPVGYHFQAGDQGAVRDMETVEWLDDLAIRISQSIFELKSSETGAEAYYRGLMPATSDKLVVQSCVGNAHFLQDTDNCLKASLFAALDHIVDEREGLPPVFQVGARLDAHLRESLRAILPELSDSGIDRVLFLAAEHNLPLLSPAEIHLNMAEDEGLVGSLRLMHLMEAESRFRRFLSLDDQALQEYDIPLGDREYQRAEEGLQRCRLIKERLKVG